MQCKYHPDREAVYFCASCNTPLCSDCAEEVGPGTYACFQCAMLQTVSSVGSNIRDRKETALEKEARKRKKWGAFHYFLIVCFVLILSMWGVIIFGGKPAPEQTATMLDENKAGRVLLFLVNGSIKRFAHSHRIQAFSGPRKKRRDEYHPDRRGGEILPGKWGGDLDGKKGRVHSH